MIQYLYKNRYIKPEILYTTTLPPPRNQLLHIYNKKKKQRQMSDLLYKAITME